MPGMLIERSDKNPILKPSKKHSWEAEAVFNGCPIKKGKNIYLVYRALSLPRYHRAAKTKLMVSDIGIAESKDGIEFHNRKRFIVSEEPWERFGCEDPRVTKLGGKYYIFYTALSEYPFRAEGIRVGVGISKDLKTIQEKHLVTPFNAKGMALFPEKIKGKYFIIHRSGNDIDSAFSSTLNFDGKTWIGEYNWIFPRAGMWDSKKIGIAAPPIKTKKGGFFFITAFPKKTVFIGLARFCLIWLTRQKLSLVQTSRFLNRKLIMKKRARCQMLFFPAARFLLEIKSLSTMAEAIQ